MSLLIPASQLYYPNVIGRITLDAAESLLGADAMVRLLDENGLAHYVGAYPPKNLRREFDFADFSMLYAALDREQIHQQQTPSLQWAVGRRCFEGGLQAFGALSGFGVFSVGLQALSYAKRLRFGLQAMALTFSTFSDQVTEVEESTDSIHYVIHRCPVCWGRHADSPICEGAGALLSEGLYWLHKKRFPIVETYCCARGDRACVFEISKTPLDD